MEKSINKERQLDCHSVVEEKKCQYRIMYRKHHLYILDRYGGLPNAAD